MVKSKLTPSAEEKIVQGLKGVADAMESGEDLEDSGILASSRSVKSRRRRIGIGLAFGVFGIVFLIAAAIYYQKITGLGDPLFSNIDESDIVAARVLSGKRAARGIKPTTVDVPPRLAFEILSTLMPNRRDPGRMEWKGLGALEFTLTSGREYHVGLFQTGEKREAAFILNRIYYRGGSHDKLVKLVRKAEELMEDENENRPAGDESD